MPSIGNMLIATFRISCSDMVTRKSWNLKHLMCFVPEEADIRVVAPCDNNCIDFQMITEDTSKSICISLENKNSIDVDIAVDIYQVNS